jgi:lambda family phage portal protein
MKILDNIAKRLGYVKPALQRGFNAAAINRLTADWATMGQGTIDSQLRTDLPTMRERSRKLARENPYFQGFLGMLKTNVLGSEGLQLKNKSKEMDTIQGGKVVQGRMDVLANKLIEDAWWEWGRRENCTVDQSLAWEEVQTLMLETAGTDGECVARKIFGADNRFGFALQLIETERLDTEKNERLANGNSIRMGVERDSTGRRIAYWLLKQNPNDNFAQDVYNSSDRYVRVPANEIIHPYLMRTIGQTRGYPWPAAIMLNLQMLGGYEEAELVAARTAACKMAVLEKQGDYQYQGESDTTGRQMDAAPGVIEELAQGLKLTPLDWNHPNSNYGGFVKAALRGMAVGLGVAYPQLASDYESVNFSSGRMAEGHQRELWKSLQKWLSLSLCDPVFNSWLPTAIVNGAINLPLAKVAKFNQPNWTGRRWQWVDPTKEVDAKIRELNAGFTSLTRIAQELGLDRDELLAEIKSDQDAIESMGVELPELWQETPDPIELEKTKAGFAAEAKPEAPEDRSVHVNLTIPPDTKTGKRSVVFERDEKGKPVGATITEAQ